MKLIQFVIYYLFFFSTSLSGHTYYLDPVGGKLANIGSEMEPWSSLEEVINANYIETNQYSPLPYDSSSQLSPKNIGGFVTAGDTLVLLEGLHGKIFLRNYINEQPITVIAQAGHTVTLESIHLQACKNWNFEGIHVSSEPYGYYLSHRLVYFESHNWQGPSSHISITDCKVYSASEPWTEAQDWIANVSHGIYVKADSCVVINNTITNIDMGLSCVGDYIIAERNLIKNFSGDGGRILGSHISFNYNVIKECYDVDDNHDDGIQSFTTNGYQVDNNEVIGNLIINTEDDTRPLTGPLQGIGCFDGFYNDWIVANNIISVNHYHGITFLGARRCTVIHNTVVDPTPEIQPGSSWIRIGDDKDGSPSSDCLVANNISNAFHVDGSQSNNIVLPDHASYNKNFVDFSTNNFNLLPTSTCIDAADSMYSNSLDYYELFRDDRPDVGAVEYQSTSSSNKEVREKYDLNIYPNPFSSEVWIQDVRESSVIYLYNNKGDLLLKGRMDLINNALDNLPAGVYYFAIPEKNAIAKCIKI